MDKPDLLSCVYLYFAFQTEILEEQPKPPIILFHKLWDNRDSC